VILDEVVLHNFGVYGGRHAITLTPPSPKKPVVLFGGLNGGGKTTLLDGLNLALYGHRARCSNRRGLGYEDYLRRSIHRRANPQDGAAVEVQFRTRVEGTERIYRVRRCWTATESGAKETVEVLLDGKPDRVLTDSWAEHVEEFIPVGLSQLFLFDGEKIEALADLDNSAHFLSSAINTLLGLELVDQLVADLQTLERRKRVGRKTESEQAKIVELEDALKSLDEQLAELQSARAASQTKLDQDEKKLAALEAKFRKAGGEVLEKRRTLEEQRQAIASQLTGVEDSLREFAAGAAPFALVSDLLADLEVQIGREAEAGVTIQLTRTLEARDGKLMTTLRRERTPTAVLSRIEAFLSEDREARARAVSSEPWLNLSVDARDQVRSLRRSGLADLSAEGRKCLLQIEQLSATVVELDRKLEQAPDEASVAKLVEERQKAVVRVEQARARITALDAEIEQVRGRREHKERALSAEIERTVDADFEREDSGRIVHHSTRVRSSLRAFRDRVVESHVQRIETQILECFTALLRKQALVRSIRIDPSNFRLELHDESKHQVDPERLSAGERQLLAVSMLWGLAKASGRPVPAVIDTPLGRLDSSHRRFLVERYFPRASHQVLLLSTDEEIDLEHYKQLKPSLGHEYRIEFDEKLSSSRITPGYFWEV
jgi:DNA sulfur modification protein DndD